MFRRLRQSLLIAVSLAALSSPRPAGGESLLVVCQPRTARGESAGLRLQEYLPHERRFTGGQTPVPGERLLQPFQLFLGQRCGIAIVERETRGSSGSARGLSNEIVFFSDILGREAFPRERDWEPVQVLCAPDTADGRQRLAIVERRRSPGSHAGRVRLLHLDVDPAGLRFENEATWAVPGAPVAAAADWEHGRIFVLGAGEEEGGAQLTSISLKEGGELQSAIVPSLAEEGIQSQPAGLELTLDGTGLCVLTSARSASRDDGGRTSTVQWIDTETLQATGDAMEIPGATDRSAEPLVPRGRTEMWARTFDEATGFAYATAIATDGEIRVKTREEGFRVAAQSPRLAASPDGKCVAVAGGRNLRVLLADGSAVARTFPQPVEAAVWTQSGLYVGEGAFIHRIDPVTCETVETSEVARGFVIGLSALDIHAGVSGTTPGADHSLPARIELDAQIPGRDARVIPVDLAQGEHARLIGADRRPGWLKAELIETEQGSQRLNLALQRQALPSGAGVWPARVTVAIDRDNAVAQQETIEIEVSSRGTGSRAIEWHSGDDSTVPNQALLKLLAAPPLHLSHRERRGPFSRPPRGSAAAVVRLEDVARGAITRQVLLDYVSGGGGLLVVAGHTTASSGDVLERWLEPLGLLIDSDEEVSGRFPVSGNPLVHLGTAQLAIAAGAYIEVTRPMDISVQGPAAGTVVLAMTRYGYGRLGVLASDTPLGEQALAQAPGRRFARALFGWLAGAHTIVQDSDHDGLRDDMEDADASGTTERGETDPLREDSDGDGVADGAEDANLNGQMDEGETDPRRADTDDDGIPDGADPEPLPRIGSPVILAVNPPSAPAQGGTLLEIAGRNLPANPQVWFGDRRATHVVRLDSTRLLAAPPPRAGGTASDPMPVRVTHPTGTAESTLERAFSYSVATPVRVLMETTARVQRAYDGYRGSFSLTLDLADVQIDYGALFVRTAPPMISMSATFAPGDELVAAGREVAFRAYGANKFHLEFGPGEALTGRVELGTFTWYLADPAPQVEKFQWYITPPDLRVQWGGSADAPQTELWTDLSTARDEVSTARSALTLP